MNLKMNTLGFKISKLYDFQKDEFNSVSCPDWFKNFEPLTEEQIKVLGLE